MASNSEYSYKSDSTNPFKEANSIRNSPSLEITSTNLASISKLGILNNIPSEEDILSENPKKAYIFINKLFIKELILDNTNKIKIKYII
jgi:hypothetical protein